MEEVHGGQQEGKGYGAYLKESSYYRDAVSFPNFLDGITCSLCVGCMKGWQRYLYNAFFLKGA